ncbi:MAG: right-handed parallel beta-helix repeat-containing protein [Hormoscilla sp. GUM202]|nr:right-handed parallel beta-helix repeat-containing protein [Hormoscilla sp. GM7CHS1pb]MBO1346362.1 right-handed parallel beta-helix repeat-containing protein [Hormoscilla sp. GUM202]
MSCCLNPNCPKPHNPDRNNFCQACGTRLQSLRGRYRAKRLLSDEGGFGRTYLAEDTDKLHEHCVIKQLAPKVQDPKSLQIAKRHFEQEAKRLQYLGQHPQIPTLNAFFEDKGQLYLVQEFIVGETLDKLPESVAWNESQIVELLLDILPVLELIHDCAVIHRDLKPSNIIRRSTPQFTSGSIAARGGQFVLIDFGASKELAATVAKRDTIIGTLGYSPIEQMQWGEAYPASDMFSLGVTCFGLLTQVNPHALLLNHGYEWVQNWRQHLRKPLGKELDRVLAKMLQKDRHRRYQSAAEAYHALSPSTGKSGKGLIDLIGGFFHKQPPPPPEKQIPTAIVSKLGRGDYKTIGQAIASVSPGTRILVRPGIYREGVTIDKPLEIIGDGAREEIVIETGDSDCILMQTDYAVVQNLTLRGQAGVKGKKYFAVDIPKGELILEDCDITSDSLSCISIQGATSKPAIRRCRIHGSKEAGIFVYQNGQGTVDDCYIYDNYLAGVAIKEGGNPAVRQCRINRNKNYAVYVHSHSSATIENCDLSGNPQGAWFIHKSSQVRRRGNIE